MKKIKYLSFVLTIICISSYGSSSIDKRNVAEEIRAAEHAKHPNNLLEGTIAANEALQVKVLEVMKTNNPKEIASYVFIGYYTKNVFGYKKTCEEQGVNISSYSEQFSKSNSEQLKAAGQTVDLKSSIDKSMPKSVSNGNRELSNIAISRHIDLKEFCTEIEKNSVSFAEDTQFSKLFPKINEVLVK